MKPFFAGLIFFSLTTLSLHAQRDDAFFAQLTSAQVFESKNFSSIFGVDAGYISSLYNNNEDWKRLLNAKEMVWSFHWRNMNGLRSGDSVQNLGNMFGVSMAANFNLFNVGIVPIDFTPLVGISYITRVTVLKYNTQVGAGSHLNDVISPSIRATVPLKRRLAMTAGIYFMHFSNAGLQNPNGGINSAGLTVGLRSAVYKKNPEDRLRTKSFFKHPEGTSFELSAGVGRRGVDSSHNGILRSGWYAGYNYFFNQVIAVKAGMDMEYNSVDFDLSNPVTFQAYGSSFDHFRTGISLGLELALNKFTLAYQVGKYLHFASPYHLKWYWKGGFRYYFTRSLALQSLVYLHGFNADYINWGIVWRFK